MDYLVIVLIMILNTGLWSAVIPRYSPKYYSLGNYARLFLCAGLYLYLPFALAIVALSLLGLDTGSMSIIIAFCMGYITLHSYKRMEKGNIQLFGINFT